MKSESVKDIGGIKKMREEKKGAYNTLFTVLMLITSMFAGFAAAAPSVSAANGIGAVTQFQIGRASCRERV